MKYFLKRLWPTIKAGSLAGIIGLTLQSCKLVDESEVKGGGEFSSAKRCEEITTELNNYNQSIKPDIRALKYEKMGFSPFIFYRGTAHIYARDFLVPESGFRKAANVEKVLADFGNEKTNTWIQGDMHVYNIGAYHAQTDASGKPNIVYDVNDFDEAVIADYKLDVFRMAASFYLIDFESDIKREAVEEAIKSFAVSYLLTMKKLNKSHKERETNFDSKYIEKKYSRGHPVFKMLKKLNDYSEAQTNYLAEWTVLEGGIRKFRYRTTADPDARMAQLSSEMRSSIIEKLKSDYIANLPAEVRGGKIVDLGARLEAGTGSLGTTRYYALLKTGSGPDQYTILDIKEQAKSPSFLPYLAKNLTKFGFYKNPAKRVLLGLDSLTIKTSPYKGVLNIETRENGILTGGSRDFTIFERSRYKKSFKIERKITSKKQFKEFALTVGEVLATAHARADSSLRGGVLKNSIESEITKMTKKEDKRIKFVKGVQKVAKKYSAQVRADFDIFKESCANSGSCSCSGH